MELVVIVIFACALSHTGGKITVTVQPEQKLVFEKHPLVIFKCNVQSNSEDTSKFTTRWFFRGYGIDINEETVLENGSRVDKYKMKMLDDEGVYELRIRNINRRDEGNYACQFGNKVKNSGKLTVGTLNDNPYIECYSPMSTSTCGKLNISCTASIGKNIATSIIIMKSHKYSSTSAVTVYSDVKKQSDGAEEVFVSHVVNVTGLDRWQFWCVANHTILSNPVNCSTPTLMTPKVKINQRADNTVFECKVEAYPPITSYQWKLCRNSRKEQKTETNGQVKECEILNSTNSKLNLPDNNGLNDGFVLICEVENAVGTGHGNLTIIHDNETKNKIAGVFNLVKWCIGALALLIIFLIMLIYFCLKRSTSASGNDVVGDQYTGLQLDSIEQEHEYQEIGRTVTLPKINDESQYINTQTVNVESRQLERENDNSTYLSPMYGNIG
ncbi:uncharacterized protein LOC117104702 [Anneissia japonica]|uniref:uncharacterized protein LOC117104702 n=1 Tax=Anneissia japonica TaxID=1529436 RepID=UPI0014257391|nr:uncharacterized protein LOC117104702 [Anneissia japonica]